MIDVDEFVQHYVTCLLWSEQVDDLDGEQNEYGEYPTISADDKYGPADIDDEGMAEIRRQCEDFCTANESDILAMAEYMPGEGGRHTEWEATADAGHNFCLSRNDHGAGFWDRGLGDLGNRLHEAAKLHGTQNLMACDDGKLYVHG